MTNDMFKGRLVYHSIAHVFFSMTSSFIRREIFRRSKTAQSLKRRSPYYRGFWRYGGSYNVPSSLKFPISGWKLASVYPRTMSSFFSEQGRTRVYAETYSSYVAGKNPRRTQLRGKRAISGWKLASVYLSCSGNSTSSQMLQILPAC